jgi:hypothetical protein
MPLSTTTEILKCFQCVVEARKNVYCSHTTRFDLEKKKCSGLGVACEKARHRVTCCVRSTTFSSHPLALSFRRRSPPKSFPAHARTSTRKKNDWPKPAVAVRMHTFELSRACERCEPPSPLSPLVPPKKTDKYSSFFVLFFSISFRAVARCVGCRPPPCGDDLWQAHPNDARARQCKQRRLAARLVRGPTHPRIRALRQRRAREAERVRRTERSKPQRARSGLRRRAADARNPTSSHCASPPHPT